MTTTTHPTTTADAFEYVTADELRELLDDTPHPDELDEALACLPLDLEAFHSHMTTVTANRTAASPAEAVSVVHEAIQACALPGHAIGVEFAALIDRAILTAGQLKRAAAAHDRAALLADLAEGIRTRDAAGLAVALGMAPFSSRAYVEHLHALADAADPSEPNNLDRLRAEQVKALQASATPGTVLDDELAGAILDGLTAWSAIQSETPQQRAIREAFTEARRLIDLHGDDDPRAFSAIIKAVELQDPGCCDRKMRECGITLPKPDLCDDNGKPLYRSQDIAEALDIPHERVVADIEAMIGAGLPAHAGAVHRLQ
jgi:hypothetical protein